MEDNGYKYIHNLTQFVTTLKSRRNRSIELIPKNVKNSDFLSSLYSKTLREFRNPKFKVGDSVRISKYDLPFRKGFKPQLTPEVFEIVAISSRKPPTYTLKDEQDEITRGKFYQTVDQSHLTRESFTIELFSNASGQLFPDNTLSSFTNFLPEQLNLEGQWERAISEKSYPSMYQKVTEGKFLFFDKKLSNLTEFYYLEPGLYPSITNIVDAMNTLIQEKHNHSKKCIQLKCLEERKK